MVQIIKSIEGARDKTINSIQNKTSWHHAREFQLIKAREIKALEGSPPVGHWGAARSAAAKISGVFTIYLTARSAAAKKCVFTVYQAARSAAAKKWVFYCILRGAKRRGEKSIKRDSNNLLLT